jgi:hypothetical protein
MAERAPLREYALSRRAARDAWEAGAAQHRLVADLRQVAWVDAAATWPDDLWWAIAFGPDACLTVVPAAPDLWTVVTDGPWPVAGDPVREGVLDVVEVEEELLGRGTADGLWLEARVPHPLSHPVLPGRAGARAVVRTRRFYEGRRLVHVALREVTSR